MKILVVSPHMPSPTWGASTRNYHLLKALASRHEVTLLALGERSDADGDTSSLDYLARTVSVIPSASHRSKRWQQAVDVVRGRSYVLNAHTLPEMQQAIDTTLRESNYHAVLFESIFMTGYRLPQGIKIIIDEHNIEYELCQRTYQQETALLRKWFNRLEAMRLKPAELERCGNADLVLVPSEREHYLLKALVPKSAIEVVPNGVDLASFDGDSDTHEVHGRIIFTGSMEYYPNIHAVLFFAQKCWPLIRQSIPYATWYIVGKNPLPEVQQLATLPGVTVTGSVADVRPYIASAEVSIVPLLIGSGTRLKILEALAMRKTVVTTSQGCEGLSGTQGMHWVVADQPEAFARAVIDFINHPEMRRAFIHAGRNLVEAEYSWEQSGARLLHALGKHI